MLMAFVLRLTLVTKPNEVMNKNKGFHATYSGDSYFLKANNSLYYISLLIQLGQRMPQVF